MACVVAMITGDSLQVVFDALGHDGSERHFRFLDAAGYLNRRGFHLGLHRLEYPRVRQPALLIVASTSGQGAHAVFWTGTRVMDPEPGNRGKRLADYAIAEWWPITRYED